MKNISSIIRSWVLAFRLKTLTAAVVPIACAVSLVQIQSHPISWSLVLCLLASSLSIQIATNLFNDAIDFKKGADRDRIGPMRVTQSGVFSVSQVFTVAFLFCGLAISTGLPLVYAGGWPIIGIGFASLFLAYGYTGGPYPLAYKGLGDIFVILFFGVIAVMGSHYILSQRWSLEALLLGTQIGCLAAVLIAVNNLRDSDTDKGVGKITLAVRYGDVFVKREIVVLIALTYISSFYWIFKYTGVFSILFISIIPAFKIVHLINTYENKRQLNRVLGLSVVLHLSYGLMFCVGCWL